MIPLPSHVPARLSAGFSRRAFRLSAGLLGVWLVCAPGARGQEGSRALSMPERRSVMLHDGRLDADAPVRRAAYGVVSADSMRLSTVDQPARLLEAAGRRAGVPFTADGLQVESDIVIDGVRYVRWRQAPAGVPVLDRRVAVAVNRDGEVSFLVNGIDDALAMPRSGYRPSLLPSQARESARSVLPGGVGRVGTAQLAVIPGRESRLAWQVFVWPDGEPAEWRVLVDAHTGEVVGVRDETVTKRPRPIGDGQAAAAEAGSATGKQAGPGSITASAIPSEGRAGTDASISANEGVVPATGSTTTSSAASVNGQGYVFDPDPLATSGASYGPPYVDADDADSAVLRAERKMVDLPDITRGNDGKYRLEGPYIRIVGENSTGRTVYAPPAEALPTGFAYDRSNDSFEAVSTYYHLDASQRYVQSLGFTDLQATPLPVNPAGTTSDDSGWIAALRYIFFGTGGVDDAEDAFVLWHEYAHALLEAGAPGLRSTLEGQALHEGWSDYWAASYGRSLVEAGATRRTDWQRAFRWDAGDGQVWSGRMLDFAGRYPEDTCSDNPNPGACSPHNDGRIWATVMLSIYDRLGRTLTDRLSLLSHRYLTSPVTFRDAAAAVVQADIDHYGGAHLDVLVEKFGAKGLLDASFFGPAGTHQPLAATESLSSSVTVRVQVVAVSSPIADVTLFYRYGNGAQASLPLTAVASGEYAGQMPLPSVPSDVHYWIRIVDTGARAAVLPAGAPTTTYTFHAGPDTTPPVIDHVALGTVTLAQWPPTVRATISDALGVAGASVEYTIRYPGGLQAAAGTFELTSGPSGFEGAFDVPVASVSAGSTVRYRIRAVDRAMAANVAYVPVQGYLEFMVSGGGLIRVYDADQPTADTRFDGIWKAGASEVGVTATPGGGSVWGTVLDAPYGAVAQRSRLSFAPMDLSGIDRAWLVFRHWYDTEHDGRAEPGKYVAESLWDGGNVKVSTDGGVTWRVLQPDRGYTGTIKGSSTNPMKGEPAFGGYAFGWRLESLPLPIGPDVRIALDFGTDGSNSGLSIGRFGWRIDEMAVTTWLPLDERPPDVLSIPEARRIVRVEDASAIALSVSAIDDVGLADVRVEYRTIRSGSATDGVSRMAVSAGDVTVFETQIDPGDPLEAGDRIEYRFVLLDYLGRERIAPPLGDPPLRIDIRLVSTDDLLSGARSAGAFAPEGDSWSLAAAGGALITLPFPVALNNETALLRLEHTFTFAPEVGSRLMASADGGVTWVPLEPTTGYRGEVAGVPAWTGIGSIRQVDEFELADWAGLSVQFRLESVGSEFGAQDRWVVHSARILQTSASSSLDIASELALHANFPDPTRGRTNISFFVPESQQVRVEAYDVLGRRVAVLADGTFSPGPHALDWDTSSVPPGLYFVRMSAGSRSFTEPVLVAR